MQPPAAATSCADRRPAGSRSRGGQQQQRQRPLPRPRQQPRRERVDFLLPNNDMLLLDNVTQHDFEYILDRFGAVGFERDSGRCSRRLEDLPAGGPVKLVVPRKPLVARQVRPQAAGRRRPAREGAPQTPLQTAPFTDVDGQVLKVLRAGLSGLGCSRCGSAAL